MKQTRPIDRGTAIDGNPKISMDITNGSFSLIFIDVFENLSSYRIDDLIINDAQEGKRLPK